MVHHWVCIISVLASLPLSPKNQNVPSPILLTPSSTHYGPDGPWQAVTVWLGSQPTAIDLYPDGGTTSTILSPQACNAISPGPWGSGGVFDTSLSTTIDDQSIQWVDFDSKISNRTLAWGRGALKYRGDGKLVMDRLAGDHGLEWTVQNLGSNLINNISMIYPDGSKYPLQVGGLALGSPKDRSWTTDGPSIYASVLTGSLKAQDKISSSSYGLHIGSASLGTKLSLRIGGNDRSRTIEPVSVQPLNDLSPDVDLLDIGIGVDHGASPFSFTSRNYTLTSEDSSVPSWFPVTMNPSAPYLALPNSTCAAIAKDLPVTYQKKYGLYFWNVDDVQYQRIVTSPSYLSFTFRASGPSIKSLLIKVQFSLLNLTLEAPLIGTPTFYFPCQPPQDSSTYSLGRAFLQAAFIGVDWDEKPPTWYFAQAPGPNTASNPSPADFGGDLSASSTV
ncbi:hypothetical protein MMC29_004919 [Sticta canariensis]|nr:hypothetical protein [Sticta canariensis]